MVKYLFISCVLCGHLVNAQISLLFDNKFGVSGSFPTSGLVAYYTFSGDADDQSGNNLDGTVTGATLTTDRFTSSNSAYDFDGVNQKIFVSDNALLDFTTSFSVAVWFNSDVNDFHYIIGRYFNGAARPWLINMRNDDKVAIFVAEDAGLIKYKDYRSSVTFSTGTWYHIVMTWSSGTLKLYIDGIEDTPTKTRDDTFTSIHTANDDLGIGSSSASTNFFDGKIDDIFIYDRAITLSEVVELYNYPQSFP